MFRHHHVFLLVVSLALLLASCTAGGPATEVQAWTGTSSAGTDTYPLTIDATLTSAGTWTGTYTVDRTPAFSGTIDATLVAGVLEGHVIVSYACRFELVGTVSDTQLDAVFTPTECDGGTGGVWAATRTTPTATPRAPSTAPSDTTTFDGGASFGAARFH